MAGLSQRERVKAYLREGNSITPLQGLSLFGSLRLSAIIYTLRYEDEMDIHTIRVIDGNKTYAKYVLARFNQHGEYGRNVFGVENF